jgi:hypothetical protein
MMAFQRSLAERRFRRDAQGIKVAAQQQINIKMQAWSRAPGQSMKT